MTLTPAQNGFVKQLVLLVVLSVGSYLANAANLTPVMSFSVASVVSALASSLESYIKAQTGQGLFGAVQVS
ncbi:hypothetical protein SCH01S_14_00260 [Sphingomonas changbaiensis NBRC 104936]|uniref:Uncharacterized protein n=1 Tax=Sphingomonas changbaiensis NBRC 104936 TaxID=1219043 RepID=A0A0E9MKQ9_9SPHN|nr:hypothetical protein [Sphingomonas changbaiensis]GAO38362.1 hypothetical protein SCH01S_14_00260 [Sphingomonas changbaiensis NBRC 104936]